MIIKQKKTNPFLWWELRRIPFNIVFLIGMEISARLITFFAKVAPPDEAISPFLMIFLVLMVNLIYTLCWVLEFINDRKSHNERLAIFKRLLYVATLLLFVPAGLHFLIYLTKMF